MPVTERQPNTIVARFAVKGESRSRGISVAVRVLLALVMLLAVPLKAPAEQLPIRTYTTVDGLPRDFVQRIVKDSHGFLWFCTYDGLSRFNGYEFTTYGVEHGLPDPRVNDLIETRKGDYWVATNGGGACRFNPSARSRTSDVSPGDWSAARFTVYPVGDEPETNRVGVLYEDRAGQLWAGTDGGLFRLEETGPRAAFRRVELNLPQPDRIVTVRALTQDREGSLWVSTDFGLVRRLPDTRMVHYTVQPAQGTDPVTSLLCDREGRMWVGHRGDGGLIAFNPEPASSIVTGAELVSRNLGGQGLGTRSSGQRIHLPEAVGEVCRYTTADGLASNFVESGMLESADGRIWIGTVGGLTEFNNGRFHYYTAAQGLSNKTVWPEVEDRDGNLWLGSRTGAMKITWSGFTTFGKQDGLGTNRITSIFETRSGELYAISEEGEIYLNRFDGVRFKAVWPQFPSEIKSFGWAWYQATFQDHTGEWWVPTGSGLCRYGRVAGMKEFGLARPTAVYSHSRGELPGDDVFRLFEDSRGDIWISIASSVRDAVVRWERATGSFHVYSETDGLPPFSPATAYSEDAKGNLWLGFYNGGLARYRDGRFRFFKASDGVPAGFVRALYLDHSGRMWVATSEGGAGLIEDPGADNPRFTAYTIAEGLSSNSVSCITEDRLGRMYFGTARGLDRSDAETRRVRHYTRVDGLASHSVTVALRDREGTLWFGTDLGLSRLIPRPDPNLPPPTVLISGLRVAGAAYPVSALGETEVVGLVLTPTRNQVSIDFVGLGFGAGEALRYQYRLADADQEWSAPTDQRTVNYASLPAGRYRFLVRAVTADGGVSPAPASISFRILPPLWRRWWVLALGGAMLVLAGYWGHRRRIKRLIELERVRTRIATDLHDDIGSSLSQIALLSEVAQRHTSRADPAAIEALDKIAESSRELVDSMSDIVWAVDPQKDRLSDLSQRMRRFASEVFTARDIEFAFREAMDARDMKLDVDVRRQVFLIFKECVNNAVRHSDCTAVEIDFAIEHGALTMRVRDNGRGFDSSKTTDGHGLANMRARAETLGGTIEIISNEGNGTTVTLKLPFPRRLSLPSIMSPP